MVSLQGQVEVQPLWFCSFGASRGSPAWSRVAEAHGAGRCAERVHGASRMLYIARWPQPVQTKSLHLACGILQPDGHLWMPVLISPTLLRHSKCKPKLCYWGQLCSISGLEKDKDSCMVCVGLVKSVNRICSCLHLLSNLFLFLLMAN